MRKNGRGLRFPCECVSTQRGYSDPWTGITQNRLLNDGTKERILNALARQPKTIAGLAKELGLSQPTVHAHINDLFASELLREAVAWEKRHPAENYYEPNFPVVRAADRAAFDRICDTLANEMARVFEARLPEMQAALAPHTLANGAWTFADVAHFCFASAQRGARTKLEERRVLPRRRRHRNGAEWIFWAEEPGSGPQ
jgi:DNA-binding transcriptional ArsR family regulator